MPNRVFDERLNQQARHGHGVAPVHEGARVAMEVVKNDRPYSEILTADWSMWNGRLDHFYARLDGRLGIGSTVGEALEKAKRPDAENVRRVA